MLYLNVSLAIKWCITTFYLTLTSVVFESNNPCENIDLPKFNFNKCCIWIQYVSKKQWNYAVFNFNKCCIWIKSLRMGQDHYHVI